MKKLKMAAEMKLEAKRKVTILGGNLDNFLGPVRTAPFLL